jgi:hypothetical protein
VTDENGVPYREILDGLIARTNRPERRLEYESELECPPFPSALDYLWRSYSRIRRRKANGFSISPIEWPDIDAFVRNARFPLTQWEVEIIEMLDDLFLEQHNKKNGKTES